MLSEKSVIGLGIDMLSVIASGSVPSGAGPAYDLAAVKILAPIPRPPKLICAGLNYRDHANEVKAKIPSVPTIFSKFSNIVIGPGEPIVLPKASQRPDYEAELAFVIGRGGRHIPASRAMEHVFGFTIYNDMTARDLQLREMQAHLGPAKGKDFDTGNVFGPCIVTRDEIDPYDLTMTSRVNGEERGRGYSREMHHRWEDVIAYVSRSETLYAGEILGSGTVGNGCGLEHRRFLEPGSVVELEISGIGKLRNRLVKP